MNRRLESGAVSTWFMVSIIFIVTTVIALGVMVWALFNYFDQKNNVDTKVAIAVTDAVKDQADKDAADFEAKEKLPTLQFAGPEDFGSVSFEYPKTWSTYVSDDLTASDVYQAYLNPGVVPPVNDAQRFALRVRIETASYDDVVNEYQGLVESGDLKSSAVKANGQDGARFDGAFDENIRGSVVIFKIRDKTVTIRTDATAFNDDFNALIATLKFNQ